MSHRSEASRVSEPVSRSTQVGLVQLARPDPATRHRVAGGRDHHALVAAPLAHRELGIAVRAFDKSECAERRHLLEHVVRVDDVQQHVAARVLLLPAGDQLRQQVFADSVPSVLWRTGRCCRTCCTARKPPFGEAAPTPGRRKWIEEHAPWAADLTQRRGRGYKYLSQVQREINRKRSKLRARAAHAIGVIKRIFGFAKVRYRGLAKNGNRLFVAAALANFYMIRRPLLAAAHG